MGCPGAGWLVAFSGGRSRCCSPNGIQQPSPLQRHVDEALAQRQHRADDLDRAGRPGHPVTGKVQVTHRDGPRVPWPGRIARWSTVG